MACLRVGTVLIAIAAVGCTVSQGGDPSFDELVAEYRDEMRDDPMDCGVSVLAPSCEEGLDAGERCLIDAAAACEPATLRLEATTDEGDPIVMVAFVDSSCAVTRFADHHADAFKGDYGDYVRTECSTVTEQSYDEATSSCATVVWEDCETAEEWFVGE